MDERDENAGRPVAVGLVTRPAEDTRPRLPDHLVRPDGGRWAPWRCVCLRGAGFPNRAGARYRGARVRRRCRPTAESGPASAPITLTEMLPAPDQTWLPDAEGRRYTGELRIVALDLVK